MKLFKENVLGTITVSLNIFNVALCFCDSVPVMGDIIFKVIIAWSSICLGAVYTTVILYDAFKEAQAENDALCRRDDNVKK